MITKHHLIYYIPNINMVADDITETAHHTQYDSEDEEEDVENSPYIWY